MLRLTLLTIMSVMAISSATETISLSHELLSGDLTIGSALTGMFSSKAKVEEEIERYLKSVQNPSSFEQLFTEFKTKFGKTYANRVEETRRREIFTKNVAMVLKNNVRALHSESQYTSVISSFSDLELDEFLTQPAGNWPPVANILKTDNVSESVFANSFVFDTYRQHHQVGPIQNQASCGACAYFAAAAATESYWARQGHKVEALSPQQLNDCARDEAHGNHGCQHGGGTFVPTFNYIKAHGLTSLKNYPYVAHDANCDHNKEKQAVAHIKNWHPVVPHSQDNVLQQAIEKFGPAAVALHVSDELAHYHSGIFGGNCAGARNHAVLAVGFGYDAGSNSNYWILKNQWGEGWGDHGFFRLQKEHMNTHKNWCDVSSDAVVLE